tara:strand:+ start:7478 stop:8791 length:1314 start_codon:yes stop_codon:yes gene_type:complete
MMKKDNAVPKMSIIVTAYNIENYIRESLDCVLAQTLQDIEVIVVDDGSTDATPDIIREYALRDPRITPILFDSNTIGGVATAANAGIDVARGDYIGFADGDDLYDKHMFARLYDAAVEHDADLAMCGYTLLDTLTGETAVPADISRWDDFPEDTVLELDDENRRVILKFVSVPWRKIYRRDLVERIDLRFPIGDYFFEDNPFHWAATLTGQRIVLIPEKLCQHRVARVGQTMATADSRMFKIFQHHDNILNWLTAQGLSRDYGLDLFDWTANQLSWISKRTAQPLENALYDTLSPIIDQYDMQIIEAFGLRNGRGNTFLMLQALKARDRSNFSAVVRRQFSGPTEGQTAVAAESDKRRNGHGNTILARGFFHLRNSGVRETARMTGRWMNIVPGRFSRGSRADGHAVTNQDLMAALAILQSDVRRLQAEVRVLRDRD